MRNLPSTFTLFLMLFCCAFSTLALTSFKTAELTSASDVQFPGGSIASGIVVVDVSLDSKGEVSGIKVQRDIASLTAVATSAAGFWKYRPATLGRAPQASVLREAFVFRPRAIMAAPPAFAPLRQPDADSHDTESSYIPPGVLGAVYPAYPIDAANVGAVVVQVAINEDGKTGEIKLIRSYNPFNRFALEAAGKWQFQAATMRGEPVVSSVVIAFVFSAPVTSN